MYIFPQNSQPLPIVLVCRRWSLAILALIHFCFFLLFSQTKRVSHSNHLLLQVRALCSHSTRPSTTRSSVSAGEWVVAVGLALLVHTSLTRLLCSLFHHSTLCCTPTPTWTDFRRLSRISFSPVFWLGWSRLLHHMDWKWFRRILLSSIGKL